MRNKNNKFSILPDFGFKPFGEVWKKGEFTVAFRNYYYVVSGKVPEIVAKELYSTYIGKRDIRVNGHCDCPAPKGIQLVYFDSDGKELASLKEKADFDRFIKSGIFKVDDIYNKYRFVRAVDFKKYPAFIIQYHIDSEAALMYFLLILQKHKVL